MTSKSSIDAEASSRKPEGQSVRVVVRVRPLTSTDNGGTCSALSINPNGQHVQLSAPHDKRTTRQFSFDAALDQHISQEDMYSTSGVQGLVDAAAQGYHSTIFAYGQTGSGKTFTMEGFKYTMPSGNSGATAAKARAPTADFQNTPQHQLGIIPRAIAALFQALNSDTSRRSVVRCSYVQIYKEQAYDLLNPTSILSAMGPQHHNKQQQHGPGGSSGALRMRWSKAEDFYLENLFKVMASHKLNASSSRSHCLLTLYIDSSPLSSPTEIISSRLTLVDLAGSERGSSIGATSEGKLRDESVAINKSLFTLRQVITCLAAASSQQQGGTTPSSHVPYRDSKLTSLLKNSLGGTSLTLMVACLAPSDAFYEENLSTLEYASKAARITNQVSLNEDAKTRLIRELRTEVAFLRQQLAAVQMGDYVKLTGPGPNGQQPARGASQIPRPPGNTSGASTQSAASTLDVPSGFSAGASAAPGPSLEEMKQKLLESTQHDVGIMVEKLLDAISLVQSLAAVNQQLRTAYDQVGFNILGRDLH
ncbi:hypothetical protein CEUSTIGMA_g712.t1 [Chlamydomonas eustigma]|uniref:Kinesin-like protein n=1 Tax=Chlamydomonas eustigma TaxID=1157962 RepID=A0A250WR10_9CHLO|nr:hypothetical protein CEUSTIGMA_g712.t1 [Chlamydomonas eustigma]|eukprot:GAX73258.1 hypothetical protein CEUSTIGMA_g712.t1 [Chlamydomonas eustigma]